MKFNAVRTKRRLQRFIFYLLISWLPLTGFLFFTPPSHALDSPIHIHQTWQHNTNTTMTVTWQTSASGSGDLVLYDTVSRSGISTAYRFNATGTNFTYTGASGYIHVVELTNLTPDTLYYFICGGSTGGYSSERIFRTAPSTSQDIRFVAGGDSRTNEAEREIVSQAMAKFNPAFVLHVGDMVENGATQALWETWFADVHTHWIGSNNLTIPIMPVIGNHEVNSINYYSQFALPGNEMWYSYDWGPDIHITCLSTETSISGAQTSWLESDLVAHANFTWKFAVFHQPPIDASLSHSGNPDARTYWVPLFDKYHVDIVFAGHDHIYMRTKPINLTASTTEAQEYENGTMYIVSGGWGAPLATPGTHWYDAYIASLFDFCVIDVFKNGSLHLQAKDDQGVTFDEAWINKSPTTVNDYDELWHKSDFTINLTVKNNLTGNAETYYRINGGALHNTSQNGQPCITTEGANNRLEYWSVGFNNDEEIPHKFLTGIKLDKTAPAVWAGTNRTIDTGTLLKLNGSKSTDNIAIEWYTWSFTDIMPSFYIGINFSYTFNNVGTIKVTLNVSDYAGWWNATSIWIQVRDRIPPIANFSSIKTGIGGNYIRFNASKSTDNVHIIHYTWDFGDGNITITDGPLISHSYLNPGRYIVNLTVTDEANNNATTSLTIQIEGKQMPFPWWVLSVVIPEGLIIILGILWLHKRTKFKTSKKSV